MGDSHPPTPKRRWFQFSLRTLLIFGLLASIGITWIAVKLHRGRKQREAVEAIEKLGGKVYYDYEFEDWTETTSLSPPAWFQRLLGDDLSQDVVHAFAGNANYVSVKHISDEHITYLSQLPALDSLWVYGDPLTDRELEHLEPLKDLRILLLGHLTVTSHGVIGQATVNPEAVKKLKEALPECDIYY